MEPSPDDPESETLAQSPPCLNPREERGAGGGGGPTSSPAVYHHPPALDEHESSEKRRGSCRACADSGKEKEGRTWRKLVAGERAGATRSAVAKRNE
nr:unnamed protein product [Digitaria exilis]